MSVTVLSGSLTLPASKWLTGMTTLIKMVRLERNLYTTDKINELIDMCREENVDFGKGIIKDVVLGPQSVNDLSKTSSLLTVEEPAVGQEVLFIDKYKTTKVSTNEIIGRDAFLDGSSESAFLGGIQEILNTTKSIYLLNNEILPMINGWTPGQATQTIDIELAKEDGLTGINLQATKAMNSSKIAKTIRKLMNDLKLPSNKYTDEATYEDPNTGEEKNVQTSFNADEMTFLANDKYWTDYLGDVLAPLPNGSEIGGMFPAKVKILPETGVTEDNADVVGWLFKDKKFAMAEFYNLGFSFFDGSNMYNHTMLHFAYGCGVFKYLPGVKIKVHYAEE